jgi:hypothetical protein
MRDIITFSVGLIVCFFGLMFLGFGAAKFRQVFTAKPTPSAALSPGQDVYLRAEVMPQNPSLHSPLGRANCVYWSVKARANNATLRGTDSAIIHHKSEGQDFFIRGESGPIRVRFGPRYLPAISAEPVVLSRGFITYFDQQGMGRKFSHGSSAEYIRRHNIATKQMGVIPKSVTLEETSICPGQVLHIWGQMGERRNETTTLEATMISAKGASHHWIEGSIAVLAGMIFVYVGSGLILAGTQGP